MQERKGVITFAGNPLTLLGAELKPGTTAPEFTLLSNDLQPKKLSDYKGIAVIISVVPSLDTGVCDLQTKRFNKEADNLKNVQILTVSCDLPFAQARWCGAADAKHLVTLSDHFDLNFGLSYGVAIKELRLLTRAIFVLDKAHKVVYTQIVPEVTTAVNFDAALAAAKNLG
ncbi:MAG: thiol peroxidase [Deltaproteobacteria bacterium]|jgi:thiol peroxidase|nr:thiol peroxidase [Deltaproteobacteria bacterium]